MSGTPAFLETTGEDIPVYAHASTAERISDFQSVTGPIAYERAAKMYGTFLDKPENCGIGPFLAHENDKLEQQVLPNRTYEGAGETITVAGIELQLIHAPGETDDQTVV